MQPENETAPDLGTDDEEVTSKLALMSRITGMSEDELLDALRQAFGEYDGDEPPVELDLAASGYFAEIAFMGRIEYEGYVTQITKHGVAAYHIDLPERLWGGNPLAWVEHAASAWFSERPMTEASIRGRWESAVKAARLRAKREAEWARMQEQRAILGHGGPGEGSDPDEDLRDEPDEDEPF
jgi:hypothetical protein